MNDSMSDIKPDNFVSRRQAKKPQASVHNLTARGLLVSKLVLMSDIEESSQLLNGVQLLSGFQRFLRLKLGWRGNFVLNLKT